MFLKRLTNLKIKNIIALKNIVLINEKERERKRGERLRINAFILFI